MPAVSQRRLRQTGEGVSGGPAGSTRILAPDSTGKLQGRVTSAVVTRSPTVIGRARPDLRAAARKERVSDEIADRQLLIADCKEQTAFSNV